jgi:hypothetical protein
MEQQSGRRARSKVLWLLVATLVAALSVTGARIAFGAQGGPLPTQGETNWPAAKAQLWDRMQQEMAAARVNPRPKLALQAAQPPPHTPDQPRQAGIDNGMHQGPFSATEFTVRNFWQGPVGTGWVLVYAGATTGIDGNAAQGALRLYSEPTDTYGDYQLVPLGIYPAPTGDADLTITGVSGAVLSLSTASGRTLSFNLLTDQYQ